MSAFGFWGLFVAMVMIFVGYAAWMVHAERAERTGPGEHGTGSQASDTES